MTSVAHFNIVVSALHRRLAEAPAAVLARAGAITELCSPQLDLWATLADRTFDALVIVVGADETAPMAPYAPLHEDPRAKGIPCLVLLDPSACLNVATIENLHSVSLLSRDCNQAALLQTIADLVQARRRTLETEIEIRALTEHLRSETQRADALTKRFGNISHDLRGLLAVAYGFSCNLRDRVVAPGSDAENTHIRRILEAIEGSTHLLESLSGSAARTALREPRRHSSIRPERVQRSLVQLGRLGREVVALLEQKAASRQMRLIDEIDDSVSVWADGLKLKQVVVNLVDNAIKYGSPGGQVKLRVQWTRPSAGSGKQSRRIAQLSVCDDGPGIAPDLRERVFERGFRGEQTDPSTGLGIGLDLVREIVVQHGGSVQCTDAEEKGAAFHVSLPADLRERDRPGLLVLRDTDAARVLLQLLETERFGEWRAANARGDAELGHLARECDAIVMMPANTDSNIADLLAKLGPSPTL